MLSRRVIAYYGLMRASESLPAAYGFAAGAAAPKENGLRWESRGSPIYSAGLCSRAASHTPATRRVRLTVSSSSVLAFTPVSRVRRHIGSFEAAEFTHSQVHRNCYGPRAGLPSFRGRLHSSLRRRGRPQSASNMTTWINSQFPRPDFHRQVQRHYGLQDTEFPVGEFAASLIGSAGSRKGLANGLGRDNLFQSRQSIQDPARLIGRQRALSLWHASHSLLAAWVLSKPKVTGGCDLRLFQRYCS